MFPNLSNRQTKQKSINKKVRRTLSTSFEITVACGLKFHWYIFEDLCCWQLFDMCCIFKILRNHFDFFQQTKLRQPTGQRELLENE